MKIKDTLLAITLSFGIVVSSQASIIQIDFSGSITDAADLGLTPAFTGGGVISGSALTGVITVDTASIDQSLDAYTSAFNWVSCALTVNGFTYNSNFPGGYLNPAHFDYARVSGDYNDRRANLVDSEFAIEFDDDGNTIFTAQNYFSIGSDSMLGDGLPDIENLLRSLNSSVYFQSLSYKEGVTSFASYDTYGKLWARIDHASVTQQQVISVAEPSSIILLALGLLGLGLARRRIAVGNSIN